MRRLLVGLVLSISLASSALAGVPFWGANESSPADTLPADLKPGEWIWGGDDGAGPDGGHRQPHRAARLRRIATAS